MATKQKATVTSDQPDVDAQLKAEIERARAAAKSRLSAPPVSVTERENPLKDFIQKFAPECVGRDAKWHPFVDEPINHSLRLAEGYEPVIDPVTKRQARGPNGVLLYKLPIELHRRNLKLVADRSARTLKATGKEREGTVRDEERSIGRVTEQVSVVTAPTVDEALAQSEAELAEAG